MKSKTIVVLLVAVVMISVIAAMTSASTFGQLTSVEVKGVEVLGNGDNVAVSAGEVLPVRVTFYAGDYAEDVRLKVWIAGAKEYAVSSELFDALNGSTYSRLVSVQAPYDIDPSEEIVLKIVVENSKNAEIPVQDIVLKGQRENYVLEILDVNIDNKLVAGSNAPLDIVLKNRGRHFAEDAFVKVSIPALGIEETAYFGDLSSVDEPIVDGSHDRLDKEDAAERRMFLNIPRSVKAGVYVLEIEAYSDDSATTYSRKIAIVGSADESVVVAPTHSKTFAAGEKASYTMTLVNSGNKVQLYELVFDAPEELSVSSEDSIAAVPAGASKTVKIDVSASKAGKYTFTTNVHSDGNLVKSETFNALVEGKGKVVATTNTTVLLTVVLAIIFVVLLVVLIVLLTRKPEKKELGESYY